MKQLNPPKLNKTEYYKPPNEILVGLMNDVFASSSELRF